MPAIAPVARAFGFSQNLATDLTGNTYNLLNYISTELARFDDINWELCTEQLFEFLDFSLQLL